MKNFIIPEKIDVGYQERRDTYTDKLAFVTYIDDLGKMRFENSWKSWCSDDIPKDKFDNVPTTGFILNKNSGKQWGHFERAEFVRVYDPRGFEIEISTDNLMKIILHNGISKGNSIEGELVYGWEVGKKKLSLMPVTCEEYVKHIKLENCFQGMIQLSKGNISKQLIPGKQYKSKSNNIYIYLGNLEGCFRFRYEIAKKLHLFYNLTTGEYASHNTLTPLTHVLSQDADINHLLEIYSTSIFVTGSFDYNTSWEMKREFDIKIIQ